MTVTDSEQIITQRIRVATLMLEDVVAILDEIKDTLNPLAKYEDQLSLFEDEE